MTRPSDEIARGQAPGGGRAAANQAPRGRRRQQAERSADTKAKLIDAAIASLHKFGYSGTTVLAVAKIAGVSRGAMSHQFPAKTDLMIEVVRTVFEMDSAHYIKSAASLPPREWVRRLPATMWEVISRPSAIALIEIMLASRSDPDLAKRLRSEQQNIDLHGHKWVIERIQAAGLVERPDGEAVHRLFVAAVRGLALEALYMKNRAEVTKSIRVLTETLTHLYPSLRSDGDGDPQHD